MSLEQPINEQIASSAETSKAEQGEGIAVDVIRSMPVTELSVEELNERIKAAEERIARLQQQKFEMHDRIKQYEQDPNYGPEHPVTKAEKAALQNHIDHVETRAMKELQDWKQKLEWKKNPPPSR